MRQQYESNEDRANQQEIADLIGKATSSTPRLVPAHYAEYCDYAFERSGEIVCFCEVKRRKMRWGQYPDVMLSVHKWMKGLEIARSTAVPWMFAVGVNGASGIEVYGLRVDPEVAMTSVWDNEIRFGGRTMQTRDNGDIEPVIHLPCREFSRIGK
jgi:hypothetical protein